jgi:cytochrome c6
MRVRTFAATAVRGLTLLSLLTSIASIDAHAQSGSDEGRKLFVDGVAPLPACALCHTLKKAGATGQIGPDLDDLRPDADRVERAMRNGIGPMPSFKALTEAQIKTLADYVAAAAGAP